MDLRLMPSVTDIAKMLDSIGTCRDGEYPETLHVLRWMIERSPAARELYDRLHARHHREPSLIELARLILAVEAGEPYPEAVYIVRRMIQCSGPAVKHYRRLEQLATDAGLEDREPDWAVRALEARAELDRLLASLDDWQDAAEAIQLKMQKEYAFQTLLNVCRARIFRGDGEEQTRLEELRRRLQAAARRATGLPDPEAELSELSSSLRSTHDPASTLETVEELIRRLRAG